MCVRHTDAQISGVRTLDAFAQCSASCCMTSSAAATVDDCRHVLYCAGPSSDSGDRIMTWVIPELQHRDHGTYFDGATLFAAIWHYYSSWSSETQTPITNVTIEATGDLSDTMMSTEASYFHCSHFKEQHCFHCFQLIHDCCCEEEGERKSACMLQHSMHCYVGWPAESLLDAVYR